MHHEEYHVIILQETPKMLAAAFSAALGPALDIKAESDEGLQVLFLKSIFDFEEDNLRWCFPDLDHVNPYKSWRRFYEVCRVIVALASPRGN